MADIARDGGGTRQFISSIGLQMMLRKIIEEKQGEWQVFQKAMEKQGFLNQLEQMITEFKRYQVTPEILHMQMEHMNQFVHKEPGEVALVNKLDDLVYIYEKLIAALKDHYMDGEDQLQLLAEKIGESSILKDAEIYIDGFHSFTPNELVVVEALMKQCHSVTITLAVDNPNDTISELDLFHQTSETYHILKQIAYENYVMVDETIVMHPANGRFKDRPYFAHLEQNFDVRPSPEFHGEVPIQIAEAVHPRAEVEGVAQEILRLVREEKYRFQDIAIFIRQTDVYHDLIQTIFDDHDIPVFIDEKERC